MNWKLLNRLIGHTPAIAVPGISEALQFRGRFDVDHLRNGQLIDRIGFKNAVTTLGKNGIFDWAFRNQANPANWYIGLVDGAGFTAVAVTDSMAAHPGWAEHVAYTEATRQAWTVSAAANAQITNPVPATFNINATGVVRGIFVVSDNVKAGVAGVLWTTGLFPTALNVVNGDQVKITYTVAA